MPPRRPGASTFTIEGRAAPGLFVVGWLASILGLAIAVAGALASSVLLVFFVGPGLLSLGLIAAAGNQAFERRARGAPYAGPSPVLVFASTVAVTYFVGALVGLVLDAIVKSSGATVSAPAAQLIGGALTALIFIGIVRRGLWHDLTIQDEDRAAGAIKRERERNISSGVRAGGKPGVAEIERGEGIIKLALDLAMRRNTTGLPYTDGQASTGDRCTEGL